MRCLVTGDKGFIGQHLVKYLEKQGHYVRGVDMEMDLKNPQNALLATTGMEWVYNLAALNGSIELTTTNHAQLIHNNALINLNMASACIKNGVKRVFFSSSACVYPIKLQDKKVHALKENDVDPAHPDTQYGWEKLFAEHIWNSYYQDYGLQVRIGRFFNIYGPGGKIDALFAKAPTALTKKVIHAIKDVYVWGDGKQKRSFTYIDDCLEAINIVMNSDVWTTVNIGTKDLVTIDELTDMIAQIEGKEINKIHELYKIQGVRTRLPNIDKIESLGWKPKVSLQEGLRKVNEYVKRVS